LKGIKKLLLLLIMDNENGMNENKKKGMNKLMKER